MKNLLAKMALGAIYMILFLPKASLLADTLRDEFVKTIVSIEKVPYNPRPLATDTKDVTGHSQAENQATFLANFTRVTISAPANGKTFKATDPANHDDITLVGYLHAQMGAKASNPWIILTHGGAGQGSIASERGFIVHIANVLFDNGYNILAVDRRDGLLSRCAYQAGSLAPDSTRSQRAMVDNPRTQFCDGLPTAFRDPSYTPNSLVTDRTGFNDILAAAKYLREQKKAGIIGVLGGSHGGLAAIRAAAVQGKPGTDFAGNLISAILSLSPVADQNTIQFDDPKEEFECDRAKSAKFYSQNINGSGIRSFSTDPVGAVEDFLGLTNGVNLLDDVNVPALVIWTLADETDTARSAFAYKAKSERMKLAHSLIMARLGHASEMWQSDPFWADQVVLTYFKRLLAKKNSLIGENPGFSSLGPNTDNPFIVELKVRPEDADKFLSKDSIAPYLVAACF